MRAIERVYFDMHEREGAIPFEAGEFDAMTEEDDSTFSVRELRMIATLVTLILGMKEAEAEYQKRIESLQTDLKQLTAANFAEKKTKGGLIIL